LSKPLSTLLMDYLSATRRIGARTREILRLGFGYLIEAVGDISVEEFGRREAERFQAYLYDRGLSLDSCNIYLRAVRPVFRWADLDPFERVRLFRVPKKKIRIYKPAEFQAMLESCSKIWQGRLLLAKTAGLRLGEVLNLTIGDVDFDSSTITIQPKKETDRTWRWCPKDKEIREVPLVTEVLSEILSDLPEGQPYLLLAPAQYQLRIRQMKAGTLQDRLRGRPDQSYRKAFQRILTRAGVKGKTYHDLRRTCLTEWSRILEPKDLMDLAGHSKIETTMTYYIALDESRVDRARKASDKMLGAAESASTTPGQKILTSGRCQT